MRIVVTGAAGFIGRMVVEALDKAETVMLDGAERRVSAILASRHRGRAAGPAGRGRAPAVHPLPGGLLDAPVLTRIASDAPDLIIHLAAVGLGAGRGRLGSLAWPSTCRARFALVEACRRMARPPVFVSRLRSRSFPAPTTTRSPRSTLPAPRSSYGTQKAVMGELLVWSRPRPGAASIRGRALRFPTISIRPGAPNRAASSFASGIAARGPLRGACPPRCPWAATCGAASRLARQGARLHAAGLALDQAALGADTTLTLPGNHRHRRSGMIDTAGRSRGRRCRRAHHPGTRPCHRGDRRLLARRDPLPAAPARWASNPTPELRR